MHARHFPHIVGLASALGWERITVALAALAGMTYLGATGHVESQAVVGVYTLTVGYVLGHSAGASKGNGK